MRLGAVVLLALLAKRALLLWCARRTQLPLMLAPLTAR
jgi:hypothetical protein